MTRRTRRALAWAVPVALFATIGWLVGGSGGSGGGGRGAPGTRGRAVARSGVVGANVNYVFNRLTYSPAQELTIVRTLAATGVQVGRDDALWEATQPARGPFVPAFDDGVAGTLAAAGLEWLPIIDYAPPWARRDPAGEHSPPADPATYAAFAAWLARRYGRGGSFWATHPSLPDRPVTTYEIWNEPDVPLFWSPLPSAVDYARLYLAARAAIHAVDPRATVLIGGLANPPGTLRSLLAAEPALRGAVDGVGIHPYGTSTTASVLEVIRRTRATIDSLGLGSVPLYLTEFGWVTSPPGANHYVPAGRRPAVIRATVDALGHTDCGLAGEILYTWITPEQNVSDPEQWYGIEPPGAALRDALSPAAAAFRDGAAAARAPGPRRRVCG